MRVLWVKLENREFWEDAHEEGVRDEQRVGKAALEAVKIQCVLMLLVIKSIL